MEAWTGRMHNLLQAPPPLLTTANARDGAGAEVLQPAISEESAAGWWQYVVVQLRCLPHGHDNDTLPTTIPSSNSPFPPLTTMLSSHCRKSPLAIIATVALCVLSAVVIAVGALFAFVHPSFSSMVMLPPHLPSIYHLPECSIWQS
jgi:hypothetical protein